jgi:two-component system, sensor histidine kinase
VLLRPLAAEKGLDLPVPEGCSAPIWVRGDSGRVRQVLMNLVGNAIKFTATGSVRVALKAEGNADFTIDVTDTGIGIAADRLEAVFDSFTQVDGAIDRQFGGTGLGLTISRMLARAMGGDVQVTSTAGKGSVFSVLLKLQQAEPVLAALPDQRSAPAVFSHARRLNTRILIAEDNRTNRLILRKMLEADNVELIEVENGAEAVARYRESAPDLVVMDMQMPVMDGLTAIRAIRSQEQVSGLPRCPILVLSANVFPEDAQASFDADCDDFLTKPVLRDTLLARTHRLLGQGAAERALPGHRLLA